MERAFSPKTLHNLNEIAREPRIPGIPRGTTVAQATTRMRGEGLERVAGIEPAYSAWKAAALPLSYTRAPVPLQTIDTERKRRETCRCRGRAGILVLDATGGRTGGLRSG